jgi:hypothetical protein
LWGHGSLSERATSARVHRAGDRPFSLVRFCPSVFRASPTLGNPAKLSTTKEKRQTPIRWMEQEPDAMSDVTIVASVVAIQAVL